MPNRESPLSVNTLENGFSIFPILFVLLGIAISCKDDEPVKQVAFVADYLPVKFGNQWIYKKENSGNTYSSTEKWEMGSDRFHLYEVLPTGEERYFGYKALFEVTNLFEISDLVGTFISVRYLESLEQDWVQIAARYSSRRWIKPGIVAIETPLGKFDCIVTKTITPGHLGDDIVYTYFAKRIGICLVEEYGTYTDQNGNEKIVLNWKKTLFEYKLN